MSVDLTAIGLYLCSQLPEPQYGVCWYRCHHSTLLTFPGAEDDCMWQKQSANLAQVIISQFFSMKAGRVRNHPTPLPNPIRTGI